MPDKNLPETYKGYSTKELLRFWKAYASGQEKGRPVEKLRAMSGLLREYKIAPVFKNPGAVSHLKKGDSDMPKVDSAQEE
jgi:hypothetical protein